MDVASEYCNPRPARIRAHHDALREHTSLIRFEGKDDPGVLRIDFPGYSGQQSLEQISWDTFFEYFDENELAFLYQDENRFNKLVSRDTVKDQLQ
jgi:hypothetical protein